MLIGRGTIVTDAEIDEDLGIFHKMGATAIRLAHMQHPQCVYERADELGLMLLTEVSLIDDHDPSDVFRTNLVNPIRGHRPMGGRTSCQTAGPPDRRQRIWRRGQYPASGRPCGETA